MRRYRILDAQYKETLQSRVTDLMREGWMPQGGVSLQMEGNGYIHRFFQAMVREDDDKTKDLRT